MITIDYKLIGERIQKYRHLRQYTQEQLAETLDVSTTYISKIERGKASLNLERLIEICSFLEVSLNEIVTGTQVNSDDYMFREMDDLLKRCPPELMPAVKEVVETMIRTYPIQK